MKYNVYPMSDEGNFFYCVFENATQQAYDFFFFEEDAKECADFLENGGAFNGFTPSFMLREVKIPLEKQDINSKFNNAFTEQPTA